MWFTARVPCDEYAGPSWAIRAKGLAHKGSYIILSAGFTWGPCGLALFSPAVTQMLPICFPYQCGLAQLFPSSFPCQPLQPVSFPHPTQLPRCFPGLSQVFPRSIPGVSQVYPRYIPDVSQVYPRCIPRVSHNIFHLFSTPFLLSTQLIHIQNSFHPVQIFFFHPDYRVYLIHAF